MKKWMLVYLLPGSAITFAQWHTLGQLVRRMDDNKGDNILLERGDLKRGTYFIQILKNERIYRSGTVVME